MVWERLGGLGVSWSILGCLGGVLWASWGSLDPHFDRARSYKSRFGVSADFQEGHFDCARSFKSLFGVSLGRLGGILPASGGASFGRRSADTAEERFDWACAIKTHFVKISGNAEGRFKRAGAVKMALVAKAEFRGKRFD